MADVLTIVQNFMKESGISPVPSTLLSPTDANTIQIIALFHAVCRDLRQAKCWPQMKKTHSFTTSAADLAYALPTDFYCSIIDTYWDTTNRWKMAGPLTDSKYNELLYGYAVFSNFTYFRVFGQQGTDQFQLQPDPGTGRVLKFDYMTKNYMATGASPYTWSEAIVANTDLVSFDDDLIILGLKAKWRQIKGLDFASFQAEFANKVDAAQARWQGNKKTSMYATDGFLAGLYPNVPEGSWTL